jgi:phosphoribosylformylglycinamidine cyclo-ligase
VFNMGHRFELYVPQNVANEIITISNKYNIDAQIVGRCEAYSGKKLTITSPKGEFVYE